MKHRKVAMLPTFARRSTTNHDLQRPQWSTRALLPGQCVSRTTFPANLIELLATECEGMSAEAQFALPRWVRLSHGRWYGGSLLETCLQRF